MTVLPSQSEWDYAIAPLSRKGDEKQSSHNVVLSSEAVTSCGGYFFIPYPKLNADTLHAVSVRFAFAKSQGNVGIALPFQLALKSLSHKHAIPLTVQKIEIMFSGGLRNLQVRHDVSSKSTSLERGEALEVQQVVIQDEYLGSGPHQSEKSGQDDRRRDSSTEGVAIGVADLRIVAGNTKVLTFDAIPRDSGLNKVEKVVIHLHSTPHPLAITYSKAKDLQQDLLYRKHGKGKIRQSQIAHPSTVVNILPKPPKVKLQVVNPILNYYTGEVIKVDVAVMNGEEEDALIDLTIESKGIDGSHDVAQVSWLDEKSPKSQQTSALHEDHHGKRSLGKLSVGTARTVSFQMRAPTTPSPSVLELKAEYTLDPDLETRIEKHVSFDPDFIDPFAPSIQFFPAVHPDPWPSLFQSSEDEKPIGLVQRWIAAIDLNPFSMEDVCIESLDLVARSGSDDVTTSVLQLPQAVQHASPGTVNDRLWFQADIQKKDVDDRKTSQVSFELEIHWCRKGRSSESDHPVVSIMRVPAPHLILSFSEPRVLVAHQRAKTSLKALPIPETVDLIYTLENPSLHMLTFAIIMEADEDYAFSGAKSFNSQLLPTSRHTFKYRILPTIRGKWINPTLRVTDVNFNQTLKVLPTGALKQDDRRVGGVLLWIAEDAEQQLNITKSRQGRSPT